MMARRSVLGVLVAGVAVLLTSCGLGKRSMRYRMTIEVDTLSGPKSGSSVLEFDYPSQTSLVHGQAPYVDLGSGHYIFGLIDQKSLPWGAFRYCEPPIPRDDVPYSEFDRANDLQPFAVLRREHYPMLVTFGDINDPSTVRELNPDSVKRITFQVVDQDEPLTEGFEEKFVKISTQHSSFRTKKWEASIADDVAGQLSSSYFVWRAK